jgi:adenosine deaminase/aminodeoxyfutalosine deaminase
MAQLHEVSCIAHIESQLSLFWISDIVRNHGPEHAEHVLDETLRLRELYSSLLGIGIGGDEVNYPAKAFWEVFHRAKAAGLRTTAHAGEATPPSAIGDAISIGAERIGHALRLMEDPTLIASLQCSQLPLEICITSNLRTRCCRSLEDHPLRRYFDAGVMVTLNSDDPAMFETTLLGEYEIAQTAFRFTQAEMKTLACNSFASSFLEPEQKQHWIETCTTYMG